MNVKTLMAKAITLLYRETQIENHDSSSSKRLINEIFKTLKVNTSQSGLNDEVSVTDDLKDIVVSLSERTTPVSYTELIQQVKIACADDTVLFESIQDSIGYETTQDELKKMTMSYQYEFKRWNQERQAVAAVDQMLYNIKFKREDLEDPQKFLRNKLQMAMDSLNYTEDEIPGIVSEIDLENIDELSEEMQKFKDEASGKRIVKMPWQALNRMTRGGFRLGQLTTIGGLAHNNKSGVTLSCFCAANIFNNPEDLMEDPKKKPMNILLSFEDDMTIVLGNLYQLLKGNLEGIKITDEDKKNLNVTEASRYISEQLRSTGYTVKIIRANGSEWGYTEIQNKIMQYEAQGYEIHSLYIDYLNIANKVGCNTGPAGEEIRDLFRRLKNFTNARAISLVTPHQLSTEALELKKQGKRDMVRQMSSMSPYDGSKRLSQEPELEIFIDIVEDSGTSYQVFARGKHRGQNDTPKDHKFFILPFTDVAGLTWDINKEDTSLSRFGATRNAQGMEETAFFDFGQDM